MKSKKNQKNYHPQHQMIITYEETFQIIQDHGPVSTPDIVGYAGRLKCNLPIESSKKPYSPPTFTIAGEQESIIFKPVRELIIGHVRALSRRGAILKAGAGTERPTVWVARLTIVDAIRLLNESGYHYIIVQNAITRTSEGMDKAFIKRITAEIRAEVAK